MLKAILLFIKTHTIATAITTTVVVTTAIATPVVVENHKAEKAERNEKQNIQTSSTIKNDSTLENNNDFIQNITESEDNNISSGSSTIQTNNNTKEDDSESKESTENNTEPLTFRIEKVELQDGTEYKVVPSYDKDGSKWTAEEKAEYDRMLQEAANQSYADYQSNIEREQEEMKAIEKSLELQFGNQ